MNRELRRAYNRQWMRDFRKRTEEAKRPQKMLSKGKCPFCTMFLTAQYHIDHHQEHVYKLVSLIQGVSLQVPVTPQVHENNDFISTWNLT